MTLTAHVQQFVIVQFDKEGTVMEQTFQAFYNQVFQTHRTNKDEDRCMRILDNLHYFGTRKATLTIADAQWLVKRLAKMRKGLLYDLRIVVAEAIRGIPEYV